MNSKRLQCERMILKAMETLDNPKANHGQAPNVEFWVKQFAKMNDKEFEEFVCRPLSIYYQTQGFKFEPKFSDTIKALNDLKVPLLERVYLPYKYKNIDGKPIRSKECVVVYIHEKRMKQMLSAKNHVSFNTSKRDAKTGLLTFDSKIARESDREFESLAISNLNATMKELSKARADSVEDKNLMNATIKTVGQVRLDELPDDPTDSMSKNLLSVYFIGASIMTNLVNVNYMTPWTLSAKTNKMQRSL